MIFDFQLISIDFAIDFASFTIWLQTYGWMDGQTDGQNTGQTDRIMGGQTNEWIDMQCMCIDMQKIYDFPVYLIAHLKRKSNENVNALVQKAEVGIIFKEVISK